MGKQIIGLLTCFILFGSCGDSQIKEVATKISIDTFPSSTILPENTVAAKRNLFYYYSLLPVESADIFYEIPERQRANLYPSSRKDSNSVSIQSLDLGNYSLSIILYKKSDARDIICLIEYLQRSNKISFYTYDIEKKRLILNEDILPTLNVQSFFDGVELDEFDRIAEIPPIYWSLNRDQSLKAALYIWMNPAFEGINVPFDLFLYWKNDEFSIEKVKRAHEEDEFDILGRVYGKRKILLGQASS